MPIIDYINDFKHTRIITWEVTESNEDLLEYLQLEDYRMEKYKNLRPKQAREYLGLRACLKQLDLDYDVNYDERGKPFLPTNKEISITHSYGLVSVGVSEFNIGIDIELARPKKILNIKHKFAREDEITWIPQAHEIEYLHIIWGIKEGLYKLNGGNLWNFLNHYRVEEFSLGENEQIRCWISDEVKSRKYHAFYKMVGDYYLVWVLDYE
ncbi:4'-phosphopantetheinyl transferase superfamily protein [Empedobacter brevis]|uniref:4'-phosphopantetheinyl transferase family protein n=1 Tax=Empedobacter brevis TaxID=247 RepID=UPI00123DB6E7|nr:4'-phosphopantetheinyl transferase superfamily protein [Empedobacter brevis]QES91713.1 4'-phosphopantetheinyl transferase superfamily protein [Empedobacter brevis]